MSVETKQIGRYTIDAELGHGGMATVYRARDTRLDRDVALKVLHPHLRAADEARRRFAREARAVAKLKHPHILEIYDSSDEEDETAYIAAELLTGPTLKAFGDMNRELPAEIAAVITLQVAEALAAAHAKGIVHRDVKPENVMLHEDRVVKLTDFGIAQLHDTQSFTATGQILGSPGHMAPEQVETGEVDARSDVFALGTVLYFLACARLPFTGRNPHQVLRRVMDVEYPDPLRVSPGVGAPLARIMRRCMERDPAARYATARELADDLRAYCATMGMEDPDAELAAFLADPQASRETIRDRSVSLLITEGSRCVDARDVPGAMEAFNRVLALDEGNEDALRRLESLGDSGSRPTLATLLVAAGVIVLTTAAAVALWPASGLEERTEGAADAGVTLLADARPDAGSEEGAADAGVDAGEVPDAGPEVASTAIAGRSNGHAGRHVAASREPRVVIFQPTPANVRIGVDGEAPREFGPAFRSVTLTPGRHTFRVVSGTDCCEDRTITREVPPGESPLSVSLVLPFRDARLYVVSNAPGDVSVASGSGAGARGRTREILSVPMRRAEDTRRIAIGAPGYARYTATVRLRAGALTEQRVTLAPEAAPPPDALPE